MYSNIHSILHFVNTNNPTGPNPINPASNPAYINWEYGVQEWNESTFGVLASQAEEEKEDEEEDQDRRRSRDRDDEDE